MCILVQLEMATTIDACQCCGYSSMLRVSIGTSNPPNKQRVSYEAKLKDLVTLSTVCTTSNDAQDTLNDNILRCVRIKIAKILCNLWQQMRVLPCYNSDYPSTLLTWFRSSSWVALIRDDQRKYVDSGTIKCL